MSLLLKVYSTQNWSARSPDKIIRPDVLHGNLLDNNGFKNKGTHKNCRTLPFLSESGSASVESGNLKKKTTILHFHDWLKEDSYELFLPFALSQEPSKFSSWFPNLLHLVDRNQSI